MKIINIVFVVCVFTWLALLSTGVRSDVVGGMSVATDGMRVEVGSERVRGELSSKGDISIKCAVFDQGVAVWMGGGFKGSTSQLSNTPRSGDNRLITNDFSYVEVELDSGIFARITSKEDVITGFKWEF